MLDTGERGAECNSAIQQIKNLRYKKIRLFLYGLD
jgi:hypothetical protein